MGLFNTIVLISVIGASNVGEISSTRLERAHPEPAIQLTNNNTKHRMLITQRSVNSGTHSLYGEASWYGAGFHGNNTASGEVFNQNALTAAHRTLPFGCRVKVLNVANSRSVTVRINDRGPFVGGRIIDLSRGAASRVGMLDGGVATVRLEPSC